MSNDNVVINGTTPSLPMEISSSRKGSKNNLKESPNHPGLLSTSAAEDILSKGTATDYDNLISTSAPSCTIAHLCNHYSNFAVGEGRSRRTSDIEKPIAPSEKELAADEPLQHAAVPKSELPPKSSLNQSFSNASNSTAELDSSTKTLEPWTSSVYRVEFDKNNKIRVLRSKNHLQINYSDDQKPLSSRVPLASFMDQLQIPPLISERLNIKDNEKVSETVAVPESPQLHAVVPTTPLTLTAGDIILPYRNASHMHPVQVTKSPSQRLLHPPNLAAAKLLHSHSRSSSNSSIASLSKPPNFLSKLLSLGGLLHFDDDESEAGDSAHFKRSSSSNDIASANNSDINLQRGSSLSNASQKLTASAHHSGHPVSETASIKSASKPVSRTPSFFKKIFKGRSKSSASTRSSSTIGEPDTKPENTSPLTTQLVIGDPELGSQTTVHINTKLLNKLTGLTVREERDRSAPSLPSGWMRAGPVSETLLADDATQSHGSLVNSEGDLPAVHAVHEPTPAKPSAEKLLQEKYGALLEMLGKGAFGEVKLAQIEEFDPENNTKIKRPVAIKSFMRRKDESTKEYDKKAIAEYCIASSLQSLNVVRTFDLIKDQNHNWSVVMEYMPGGDLFSRLRHKGCLGQDEINCYFKQLVSGVSYLHSMGVAHRDIKPENLLLDGTCRLLKLADFGTAEVFKAPWQKSPRKLKGVVGSGPYIAPEEFEEDSEYDAPKVDIWACAMIYHTMVFQSIPWRTAKKVDPLYARYLANKTSHIFVMSRLTPAARSLIYKMFEPDSSKRISSADILLDPFILSIQACSQDPLFCSSSNKTSNSSVSNGSSPNKDSKFIPTHIHELQVHS